MTAQTPSATDAKAVKEGAHLTAYRMLVVSLIGLVVGLISAFATIGFVELVAILNDLLMVSSASRAGVDPNLLTLVTISSLTLGGLCVGLLLHYGVKGRRPLGVPDAIYAVQLREKLPDPKSGIASTLAAIVSLGCGASVGQYSPLVYLGSLVGQMANRMNLGVRDIRSIAIACGVAAAISTAFNAPIAGLIFTHEVILRHYSLRIFTAVTVATACGFIVANVIFDHPPLFLIEFNQSFHASEFFLFALEGISCGLLAVVFMKLLNATGELARRLQMPGPLKTMLAGFIVAVIALQVPQALGVGQDVLHLASTEGNYSALQLGTILVAKIFVTVLCIGFGFAGGIIFPALLVGILFGALFAIAVPELLLAEYSGLSVYAVCAMVAVASPVIGAPLTALLIIFELTRNYEITIAAMVTVVFANLIAYHWYGRSLFDTQLAARGLDLSLGRDRAYLQHHHVCEYASQPIPRIESDTNCKTLINELKKLSPQTAVVVDKEGRYVGLAKLDQLLKYNPETALSTIAFDPALIFDEHTSLWEAMDTLRTYVGEAIPVVHSVSGIYLGSVPEAEIISAYLNAIHDLRREEHQA